MSQKRHSQVVFKPYAQDEVWQLPPTLGELIPEGHLVRLVSDAIDEMDLEPILNTYKGGGSSSYHPRMMLKVLVYGYVEKCYSSRSIEKALKENICFMWLSGMQQVDHNTINRFRNSQLKQTVKEVFALILAMLVEQGYVRLKDYFLDGTKIESVANRYTFAWAKNVERYKSGLLDKIAALIEQVESINEKEEALAAIAEERKSVGDSVAVQQTINQLKERLQVELEQNKKLSNKLKKLEQEHLTKLRAYEEQERLLQGRSSYAKTDVDATFMRTKDDHLGDGQLKPCYNVQLGTEAQFIINYSIHQSASDIAVLKAHMDDTEQLLQSIDAPMPQNVGADAGYGSEENYTYLEEKGVEAFVKYSGYYQEQKYQDKEHPKKPFQLNTLHYNEAEDYYVCPMGQHMRLIRTTKETTQTGYEQEVHYYQAQRCEGCPLRGQCHDAKGNRIIQVNHKAWAYRKAAAQRLNSLKGIRMRKQRNVDVEPVFGHIKQDRHFRRFLLTGLQGVATEMGLLAIAHNLKKWHATLNNPGRRLPPPIPQEAKMVLMRPNTFSVALQNGKIRA